MKSQECGKKVASIRELSRKHVQSCAAMAIRDADKPPFARWLTAQRKARAGTGRDGRMKLEEAIDFFETRYGWRIARTTWAELESGSSEPNAEQYKLLTELWGSEPDKPAPAPEPAPAPAVDVERLLSKMDALVDALSAQTTIAKGLQAQIDLMAERLEKLASKLEEGGGGGGPREEPTRGGGNVLPSDVTRRPRKDQAQVVR